jgi:hypothetical protein
MDVGFNAFRSRLSEVIQFAVIRNTAKDLLVCKRRSAPRLFGFNPQPFTVP